MPEKVIIIGSGPAGWTAAIYAARANLQPLVFEGDGTYYRNSVQGTIPLGQLALTTEVENFPSWPPGDTRAYLKSALPEDRQPFWVTANNKPQPGHGINGPELMELMRQQAVHAGARVVSKDVVKIDLRRHPFTMTAVNRGSDDQVLHGSEERAEALTVIVATGARANYLGLPSEDAYKNRGVSACAVCDGALPPFRNKSLVVVGGGDSAVEEATYLTKFASEVHMVLRRDKLRASKVMAERALNHPKIKFKWNSAVDEVVGDENWIRAVRLRSTVEPAHVEELPVSGMFLAIGHTPNVDFLGGQLDLTHEGYVKWTTPQRTYTSIDGVFAAGDVGDDYYRQACTAAGSGCMAALDAERWLAARGEL